VYIKLTQLLLFYKIEEVGNFKSENIFDSNTAELVDISHSTWRFRTCQV